MYINLKFVTAGADIYADASMSIRHKDRWIAEDPASPFTPTQFQNLQTIRNQNPQQNKIIKTTRGSEKVRKPKIVHTNTTITKLRIHQVCFFTH